MIVAMFGLAAANELDRVPLARWRIDGAAHPQTGRVVRLIDHLEGLFVTGAVEPWATVRECASGDPSHHKACCDSGTNFVFSDAADQ